MKKMRRLLTVKPHRYGTRHLVAGDEYEADARHAVALVASRKARFATSKQMPTVPPTTEVKSAAEATAEAQGTGLDLLREQATRLGIDVDGRWGIARLQHEIAQVRK